MKARTKPQVSRTIGARASKLLLHAEELAAKAADWLELEAALFGPAGKANELFTTESERTAFTKTKEYRKLLRLLDSLPRPKLLADQELISSANGAISVRLPRSVHAALLAEAKAEGVSLNQLCVAKLVGRLRTVVEG